MKSFIITLSLFLLKFTATGQTITVLNDKTIGGPKLEFHPTMLFYDGHLIVMGSSNTNIGGDKTDTLCDDPTNTRDFWYVELSDTFDIIFNRSIGGGNDDIASKFIKSNLNSNIYLSGHSRSNISCEKSENNKDFPLVSDDFWLVCIDSANNIIFDKTYGASGSDLATRILELTSGNLIIIGESSSQTGGDKSAPFFGITDYWIIKIDSSGNKLWDSSFGGSGREQSVNFIRLDLVSLENNDEFVIAGTTDSPLSGNITTNSIGGKDIIIAKFDSSGNIIWQKRYGGLVHESSNSILKCSDGGFLIGGYTTSPQGNDVSQPQIGMEDAWLLRLDSLGNKMWDKRFGGLGDDGVTDIIESPNGFYVTSYTSSQIGFDISENPYGLQDFWFMEIDSFGNKLWDVRFGGPGFNYPSGCILFDDSTLLLYGHADSGVTAVKTDPGKGGPDYWMIHFRKDSTTSLNEIIPVAINLFPNPTTGIVTIPSVLTGCQLTVYDCTGRNILHMDAVQSTINLYAFENGLYTLYFTDGKQNRWSRMILMK